MKFFNLDFILALLIIAAQTPFYIYFSPHFVTYLGCRDVQDNQFWLVARKQLILEAGLMRPLDRVASMAVLTASNVENVFKFERAKAPALRSGQTRVYLISANLIMGKLVADQVSEAAAGSDQKVLLQLGI